MVERRSHCTKWLNDTMQLEARVVERRSHCTKWLNDTMQLEAREVHQTHGTKGLNSRSIEG